MIDAIVSVIQVRKSPETLLAVKHAKYPSLIAIQMGDCRLTTVLHPVVSHNILRRCIDSEEASPQNAGIAYKRFVAFRLYS